MVDIDHRCHDRRVVVLISYGSWRWPALGSWAGEEWLRVLHTQNLSRF